MSRLTTDEEIEIVNKAITVIQEQRAAIADLRLRLGTLPEENEGLKAALAAADAADASADARLIELGTLLSPNPGGDPTPEPEAPEPEPEPEPGDGDVLDDEPVDDDTKL